MGERWVRQGTALVVSHREALTIVSPGGKAWRFADASADLVRAALDFWVTPHTEDELVAHLRALAGDCDPSLVAETTACLRDAGAIRPATAGTGAAAAPPAKRAARARVLVGVSGAIAATDAPALVRMLLARRFDVTAAMTPSARRFVSADSLEAITHRPVYRSFWRKNEHGPAPHIHLAHWADLIVLYPASAATIARVAHGHCSDVLSAAATASSRPLLVVPSMNESMYRSAAVQRNLELLREDGHHVVYPGSGVEVAWEPAARVPMLGAAPPPSQVVAAIELVLNDLLATRAAAPSTAEGWDEQYLSADVTNLPWFTDELDGDIAEELRATNKGRLLDVGTGPGTAAIFAAKHGFDVVATDISEAALATARRRANGLPITWVLDDATHTHVWGQFDVAVDRGCLHCLPRSAWPEYAAAASRWIARRGRLLLKLHAPEEGGRHGTHPASADEIGALFGGDFSVAKVTPSVFDGTLRPSPRALLAVLVRNG
jgi:SAM-dependent methyltransferase/3-polyprenyl-4-hydroxybenzoate decarboxylase